MKLFWGGGGWLHSELFPDLLREVLKLISVNLALVGRSLWGNLVINVCNFSILAVIYSDKSCGVIYLLG